MSDDRKLVVPIRVTKMEMKSLDVTLGPGQHEIWREPPPIPWQRLKDADARLFLCHPRELYLWWTRVGDRIEVFTGRASYWSVQHCIMIERRLGSIVRASDDAWFAVITEPVEPTVAASPASPPPSGESGPAVGGCLPTAGG